MVENLSGVSSNIKLSKLFLVPLRGYLYQEMINTGQQEFDQNLGPVVQSVISLTSSLRVISLTVLADSIHNILIFFAEKM